MKSDVKQMPQEEVKFFREFFEYRKATYLALIDDKYWESLVNSGIELTNKYKDTSFYQFAVDLVVAHQREVARRFYGE